MKTKMFLVEPINNIHGLAKDGFERKIYSRLAMVHRKRKLTGERKTGNTPAIRKDTCKLKLLRSKICPAQKATIFSEENVSASKLMRYVDSAMKLQQNGFEAAMDTIRAYENQMLIIFLEAFVAFVVNCYYVISVIAEPDAFKLPQAEALGYLSQHMIQPICNVVIIVVAYSKIKNRYQESQGIVNKIIIHTEDKDLRERFLAFSHQLQTNIPTFTVYGFFSLDGSVLFSMISATTTYLIILVQTFNGSYKNENQ